MDQALDGGDIAGRIRGFGHADANRSEVAHHSRCVKMWPGRADTSSMPTVTSPTSLRSCLAAVLAVSTLAAVSPVETVAAADAPWVTPDRARQSAPRRRSTPATSPAASIPLGPGLPETRGWPAPPYPDPTVGAVLPWVDLTIGVQRTDGGQGAAGPGHQRRHHRRRRPVRPAHRLPPSRRSRPRTGLPATGIVNEATATALGVQNTGTGAFPPVRVDAGWAGVTTAARRCTSGSSRSSATPPRSARSSPSS